MIINFLPKPNEIIEQSIMFNESLRGFGYKCKVLIPSVIDLPEMGYHQDVGYDEESAFYAYVSFDSHPTPKLLNNLGWNTESDDTKPLICYISKYIQPVDKPRGVNTEAFKVDPTIYTRLVLDYDYEELGKEFIVTKVSDNHFNPVYRILMIVPYRPRIPDNPDPLQDNNVEKINLQEFDNQFRFTDIGRKSEIGIKY